jgi:hypothetical protein
MFNKKNKAKLSNQQANIKNQVLSQYEELSLEEMSIISGGGKDPEMPVSPNFTSNRSSAGKDPEFPATSN